VVTGEIERRYRNVREAMARDGLDAVIVSGNEYTGFEGAVTYMSGFVIVHGSPTVCAASASACTGSTT
jgi:hypothetical protein